MKSKSIEAIGFNKSKYEYYKDKLVEAEKKLEVKKQERRFKQIKGYHLFEQMLEMAKPFNIDKKSIYYKITGSVKGKKIYISLNGGKVDFNGFTIESDAVIQITKEQAKKKNIGRVMGQLNFDCNDSEIMLAYKQALENLNTK